LNERRLLLELQPLSVYQAKIPKKVLNSTGLLAITEATDEDDEESKDSKEP
jgi:hypothetical protein